MWRRFFITLGRIIPQIVHMHECLNDVYTSIKPQILSLTKTVIPVAALNFFTLCRTHTQAILSDLNRFKMLTFYILFVFGVSFIHADLADLYPRVDSNLYVSKCK